VSPFGEAGVPVVVSTDDGSVGLRGWVTDAMNRYDEANPVDPSELVVYTCGPEPMMKAVATWCARRDIDCQVCMERNMACGMGTCQSCVVPCREGKLDDAWRYRLCCSDGPVFDRRVLVW
jgi:dihydroorotate dehydrogenase electron transfer subunit